jgi:hypothetical protein
MAMPSKEAAAYWSEVEQTPEYKGASLEQKREARRQWRQQFGLDAPAKVDTGGKSPAQMAAEFNPAAMARKHGPLPQSPAVIQQPRKLLPQIQQQPQVYGPPSPVTNAIGPAGNALVTGFANTAAYRAADAAGRPLLPPQIKEGLAPVEGVGNKILSAVPSAVETLGLSAGLAPILGPLAMPAATALTQGTRYGADIQEGKMDPGKALDNLGVDVASSFLFPALDKVLPGGTIGKTLMSEGTQSLTQALIDDQLKGQAPNVENLFTDFAMGLGTRGLSGGLRQEYRQAQELGREALDAIQNPIPLGDLEAQRGSFNPLDLFRRNRETPEGVPGGAAPVRDAAATVLGQVKDTMSQQGGDDQAQAALPPQKPPRPPAAPTAPTPPAGGGADALAANLIENAQAQARGETLPDLPRGGDQTPGDPNFQVRNVMDNEDQGRVFAETAKAFEGERDAAKRGVIGDEQNKINAALLGMTEKQLQSRELGKAYNAEQLQAAIDLTKKSAQEAADTSKTLAAKIEDGSITDADRLAFVESLTNHAANQIQMEGAGSEVARALRVLRQAKEAKQKSAAIKKVMDQYGGTENVDDMIKALATLPPEKVPQALNNLKDPTWWEALSTLRKAGLMSGIKTVERNMISTGVNVTLQEEWVNLLSGGMDALYSARTGRDRVAYGASIPAMLRAGREAATVGAKNWWQTVKTGTTDTALAAGELRRELNLAKKVGLTGWKAQALNTVVNMPFRLSNDEIFRAYANRRFLEGAAKVAAINEAKAAVRDGRAKVDVERRTRELVENPTEPMLLEAMADVDRQTYNNANMLADKLMAFDKPHIDSTKGQALNFLRNQIQPFIKVPINWFSSQVLDQTGVRPLVNLLLSDRAQGKGSFMGDPAIKRLMAPLSDAERKAIYRAVGTTSLGLAQYLFGQYMAKNGLMTGLSAGDTGDRSRDEEAGIPRGAIKFNGEWRQIAWLFPVAVLGASMYESGRSSKRLDKQAAALAGSVAGVALEHPMLSGVRQTVKALENPMNAGERWVSSQVGSFVPTALSDVASLTDDKKRVAESWHEGVMMRTPGLRQMLPEKTTAMGQTIPEHDSHLIDVFRSSPDRTDNPVVAEIVRTRADIARQSDTVSIKIKDPDNGMVVRVPVRLEPDERNQINRQAGKLMTEAVEKLMRNPQYQSANPDKQKEQMDTLWKRAKSQAKQEWQAGHLKELRAKATEEIGAGHGEFYDQRPHTEDAGTASGAKLF